MTFRIVAVIVATAALLGAQPTEKKVPESAKAVVPAPRLETAKLWRLVAKTQALRVALNETQAAKDEKAAEEELQAEQARLAGICGADFVLGYDQDSKSPTYQDVICLPKPKESAKAMPAPVPPTTSTKEK